MLKFWISVLDFASVMALGSAATGRPPLLPIVFWTDLPIVVLMNSSASSLFLECAGTTQMLPLEPRVSWLPGHWKVAQLAFISFSNRPYHQLPENSIGNLPCSKATPASSALRLEEVLAM